MNNGSQIRGPRGSLAHSNRTTLASLTKFRSTLNADQQPQTQSSLQRITEQAGPSNKGLSNTSNYSNTSQRRQYQQQQPPQQAQQSTTSRWKSNTNKPTNTRSRNRNANNNNTTSNNYGRSRNNNINNRNNNNDSHSSSASSSRDHSLTRNRRRNNNNNKENMVTNNRRNRNNNNRPKSRTRNNGYKKPMTLNEVKERNKSLKQQLNEVNEAYDRLNGEKEDLEDELNNIHERNGFDIEQRDKKINDLQRDKMKIENENNLNRQKIQNLQQQIQFKEQQIQMAQTAKNAADQQLVTMQQSIKMKDDMLNNNKVEIDMIKSQNNMLNGQCQSQQKQIQELNNNLQQTKHQNRMNENEIKELKSENMTLSLKNSSLTNQNETQFRKIQELTQLNDKLNQEISFNQQRMQNIQRELHSTNQQKDILENECKSQSNTINQQIQRIKELEEKCVWYEEKARKDEETRKRLHNTIQELKGNIRVFCRVRPILDQSRKNEEIYEFDNDDIEKQAITLLTAPTISGVTGKMNQGKTYNFDFDRVFRPFAKQDVIFDEISQLVQSALDGYKVCIFAYGQTGSGKTYTMEGPSLNKNDVNRGMIPRSVEKIFEHKHKLKEKGWSYKCMATYLEIYNEKIRDLLVKNGHSNSNNNNNNDNIRYLEIHQKKNSNLKGGKAEVYVEGLTEIEVNGASDVYPLLHLASRNRSVGKTDCNERSSRSHSVFQLFLNGYNEHTQQSTFGVLNLIDLAGSERLKKSNATGIQLKETQNINKSLSCLGDVISALSAQSNKSGKGGRSHIPYRNSKLTYLLQNYFGGDAKTLMFVNLCPEKDKIDESLCSLRFAAKVNDCQIGIAKRTTTSNDK